VIDPIFVGKLCHFSTTCCAMDEDNMQVCSTCSQERPQGGREVVVVAPLAFLGLVIIIIIDYFNALKKCPHFNTEHLTTIPNFKWVRLRATTVVRNCPFIEVVRYALYCNSNIAISRGIDWILFSLHANLVASYTDCE